jgi:hypothetical protein
VRPISEAKCRLERFSFGPPLGWNSAIEPSQEKVGTRPTATYAAAICYVRFTSIAGVQSVSFVRFRPMRSSPYEPLSFDP